MRAKKIRQSQCLSPAEILAKVKRQMSRQKQYQKMQQNLLYLNNSFNNNIQIQEIFIDICKGKKKKIKSKQFKTMYTLFSQNKANLCIFQKIVNQQLLRIKNEKMMTQTTFSKWVKDTRYLMEIIEQDQSETQKNIKTNKHIQAQRELISDKDNTLQKQQPLHKKQDISSMTSSRRNSSQNSQQQQELQFLIRRVYCRLIQKILVKISFYTMNNKFLDFIALNILEITKNLEVMIRRLSNIKDLRLLQQIVLKVYRQNLAIESKIYEMLIDGGYILSIDEFYRVNGIDVAHKDVYERNSAPDQNHLDNIKRAKLTLKQKIMKMKQKKERENVVKKQYIDKTNNQINEKYLFCISEIKKLISDGEDKPNQQDLSLQTDKTGKKSTSQQSTKRQSIFSKTQPTLQRTSFIQNQKLSRFSSKVSSKINDPIEQEKNNNNSRNSVSSSQKSSRNSSEFKKSRLSKDKSIIQYSSRISTFSPEFTKLIKSQSANKIQRSSIALSEKFLKFNEFQKKQRKQSKTHSESEQGQNLKERQFKAIHKKKSSDTFETIAINKLLRLYEARNTDRYSIDNFLGSSIRLPAQVRQSLRQQLLKLKGVYDPTATTNSSRKQTALQVYNFQDRKTLQNSYHLPKKKQQQDQNQNYSDRSSQGHSSNRSQSRKIRFSYTDALLKKQSSLKDENRTDHSQQQRQKDYFSPKIIQTLEQKQDDEYQEQRDVPTNIRETCLVRLSKDRIKKVDNIEKISPVNNSLFTACGVRNIYKNQLQDQTPLKNQKLKRIAYIKTKNRFTESNDKKVSMVENQVSETNQCQLSRGNCPKIFRRAYHSTHLQNQLPKQYKTVQEVIKRFTQSSKNRLENLNRNQIYYNNKSLHKLSSLNKTTFSSCRKQRVDRFHTFYPKFMDNSMGQNQTQNTNFGQRKVKMKTAHNFIRKSDLSVGAIEQQTEKNNIFEIYDIRKRKKIPK